MNKLYDITEENINFIEQVRKENHFKSQKQAINYIISEYNNLQKKEKSYDELADLISQRIIDNNKNFIERIRWATQTAEHNSIYIMDILNTILSDQKIEDCVPVDVIESPVITTSKAALKEKLDHFKQAKDDRKLKRGSSH